MTRALDGEDIAQRIRQELPESVVRSNETDVWVHPGAVAEVSRFLKDADGLDFGYLTSLTAVDYVEYFELVYHLLSMRRNHSVVLKTRIYGRESPTAQSVIDVWQGADLQEREVWDLMGIRFDGHPNMKRILLWEGFPGHPLRKDFLG